MKEVKLILIILVSFFAVVWLLLVTWLYFSQESIIFPGEKLSKEYVFHFPGNYEEVNIPVTGDVKLNGLLFKTANPKGLVFYLHGNGGNLDGWGAIAGNYTENGYDMFMLDYRGYGKSDGAIKSETQFLEDIRTAYSQLLKRYDESSIIIIGHSLGTGPATILAAENHPKALVLKAPYYSLTSVIKSRVPFMPRFLQKYKLETFKYLPKVRVPVYIFHGKDDNVIPYSNSLQLKKLNDSAILALIPGAGHNLDDNPEYKEKLKQVLE